MDWLIDWFPQRMEESWRRRLCCESVHKQGGGEHESATRTARAEHEIWCVISKRKNTGHGIQRTYTLELSMYIADWTISWGVPHLGYNTLFGKSCGDVHKYSYAWCSEPNYPVVHWLVFRAVVGGRQYIFLFSRSPREEIITPGFGRYQCRYFLW